MRAKRFMNMPSSDFPLARAAFAGINDLVFHFRRASSGTMLSERRHVGHIFLSAAVLLLGISAFIHSVNHDESQYVAAIALMRQGVPYRDFGYLQTPLFPLLLSPLAFLPAGWVMIGARAVNAAFGLATILILWTALRNRASADARVLALGSLTCTGAFLLASSLARNDALAMVLLAAAVPTLLAAMEQHSARMFAFGGLALGLAISAKINAALPSAAAGLFLLLRSPRYGFRGLLAFGGGLCLGLLPTLVMAWIAPSSFRFDVFDYNFDAPVQWWASISQAAELNPLRRLLKLIGFTCLGSVFVALAAATFDRTRSDDRRLLDFLIVGGLIAAFLPVPALVQYLVPVLPPLFARFALALDAAPPARRAAFMVLAGVGSIVGLASNFVVHFAGSDLIRSPFVGEEVAALAHGQIVASLSPEYMAGEGVLLDGRFAAGPFLYRTRGTLARIAQVQGRAVTAGALDEELDASPPRVIVVGAEAEPFAPYFPKGLDQPLIAWASAHGYRPTRLGGGLVALVAPRSANA